MRVYQRKITNRGYRKYTKEKLNEALSLIRDGLSVREVSKLSKIPRSTLNNRATGRHSKTAGGQTVLVEKDEEDLIAYIVLLSEWGFPLDSMDLWIPLNCIIGILHEPLIPNGTRYFAAVRENVVAITAQFKN